MQQKLFLKDQSKKKDKGINYWYKLKFINPFNIKIQLLSNKLSKIKKMYTYFWNIVEIIL